jgi:hypothetical protein
LRTEVADTRIPSLAHSPQIRRRVLPYQPQDQLDNGRIEARLDTGLTGVGQSTSHELPMPAQERGRRDQEHRPALPRQQPGQRGHDQRSVGAERGRGTWRCSTANWWRRTAISTFLSSGLGPRPTSPKTRRTRRKTMVEIMPVILEMPIVAAQSRDRLLAPFTSLQGRLRVRLAGRGQGRGGADPGGGGRLLGRG